MKHSFLLLNVICSLVVGMNCQAQVVINEIFYHAPDDLTDLQWVELYNTSDKPVNLAGWRLTKAVKFEFKPGTELAPNGYAVVCKDKKLFQESYQSTVAGEFTRSFKHNGE